MLIYVKCEHGESATEFEPDDLQDIEIEHNEDTGCDCSVSEFESLEVDFSSENHTYSEIDFTNNPDDLESILKHDEGEEIYIGTGGNLHHTLEVVANGKPYASGEAYAQEQYEDEDLDFIITNAVNWSRVWHQLCSDIQYVELEDGTVYVH